MTSVGNAADNLSGVASLFLLKVRSMVKKVAIGQHADHSIAKSCVRQWLKQADYA